MAAELFDLLPRVNARLLPRPAVLGSEPFDRLWGEEQVGVLAGGGDLPSGPLVLVTPRVPGGRVSSVASRVRGHTGP